jgi:hypothetical protein
MPIQPSPYRWLRAGISRLHGRFASGAMLVVLLLLGAMSSVRGGSVTIQNPSFETGGGDTANYSYQSGLFNSWTYSGRAGIASNGSPWFAPAAPDGTHAAFIQTQGGASSIAQTLTVPAGTYVLTFKAVARTGYPSPDLSISFAGATIATYSASTISSYGETWTTYTTNSFVVSTAGDYELKFTGLPLEGSDRDVAIDQVSLNGSPPIVSASQLLYETTTPNRDANGLITYTSGYGLGAGDAAEQFRLSGKAIARIRYRMELSIGSVAKFAAGRHSGHFQHTGRRSE